MRLFSIKSSLLYLEELSNPVLKCRGDNVKEIASIVSLDFP